MRKLLLHRTAPFLFAAGIFILDVSTPLGYEVWPLYLFPSIWASWLLRRPFIYVMAVFCSVLTMTGFFLAPSGILLPHLELFNRCIAIGVGWIFSFLVDRHRGLMPGFQASREAWEKQIEQRKAELEKAKENLQQVNMQLIAAQEAERKRIAQELHDGLVGQIAAVKYKLEKKLQKIKTGGSPSAPRLEEMIGDVQRCLEESRRIMMNLRPSVLDDLGLIPTIAWYCREFEKLHPGIPIRKQMQLGEEDIPEALKTVVFRVIQEALTNTVKHSAADAVSLVFAKRDGGIELVIRDNGRGFDPARIFGERKGLGLYNMKERVEFSGGSYSIDSGVGSGTTIRAKWPS